MGKRTAATCFLLLLGATGVLAQDFIIPVDGRHPATFVPAVNTLFADDFSGYRTNMFPSEKWKGASGEIVKDANGVNVFNISGGKDHPVEPLIQGKRVKATSATFECDFRLNDTSVFLLIGFRDNRGRAHYFAIDRLKLVQYWGGDANGGSTHIPIQERYGGAIFDPFQWHRLHASFSKSCLDVFIDGHSVLVMRTNDVPVMKGGYVYDGYLPVSFDIKSQSLVALRYVRLAQNNVDLSGQTTQVATFNKILTGDKFVTHDILFEVNSAAIRVESDQYVSTLGSWLRQNPAVKLEIAGHTDSDGDGVANMELSRQRATAILNRLISLGIAADRLKSVGYGESKPVQSNATEIGKAANRRVEFRKL